MRPRSMARELKGTVKEILGTCQSVGCTIDGTSAPDMLAKARSPQPTAPPAALSPPACCDADNSRHAVCSGACPAGGWAVRTERTRSFLCLTPLCCSLQVDEGEVAIPDK